MNQNYLEKGSKCLFDGNRKLAVKYWEEGLKETLFNRENNLISEGKNDLTEYDTGNLEKRIIENGKSIINNHTDRLKPLIDGVYSLSAYRSLYDSESGDPVSALLRYFKKSPKEAQAVGYVLGKTLISFLRNNSNVLNETDIVIPVPMSYGKKKERGYNQAELLAKPFEELPDVYVRPDVLVKTRDTADLRYLNAQKREKELRGAFKVTDYDTVMGNSILLVDDIITYGATLKECARALRISGAEKIYAVTVAKSESSMLRDRQKYHGISILSGVREEESKFRSDDYLKNLENFIRVYYGKNTQSQSLNSVTTS